MSDVESTIPAELESAPPSCKYVYHVLETADGPVPRQELIEETYLPESTLVDALESLDTRGYLLRTRESEDLRQVSYEIR